MTEGLTLGSGFKFWLRTSCGQPDLSELPCLYLQESENKSSFIEFPVDQVRSSCKAISTGMSNGHSAH